MQALVGDASRLVGGASRRRAARLFTKKMSGDNLQVPTPMLGVRFFFSSITFLSFVVVLSVQLVHERQPVESFELRQSILTTLLTNTPRITSRAAAQAYLLAMFHSSPLFAATPYTDKLVFLNPTRVRVQRGRSVLCHLGLNTPPVACFQAVEAASSGGTLNTSDFSFRVNGSVITMPFIESDDAVCVGALCSGGYRSRVISTTLYDFSGNAFLVVNGSAVNPTNPRVFLVPHLQRAAPTAPSNDNGSSSSSGSTTTTSAPVTSDAPTSNPMGSPTSEPSTNQSAPSLLQELTAALVSPGVQTIFVEQTVYCPTSRMVASATLLIELHASGTVKAISLVATSALFATKNLSIWFLWAYGVLQLGILSVEIMRAVYNSFSKRCMACSRSLLVYNCLKCKAPRVLLVDEVSRCEGCAYPIPALRHRCIRRIVGDPWQSMAVVSMVCLFLARTTAVRGTEQLDALVEMALSRAALGSKQTATFLPFAQTIEVCRFGTAIVIPTVILTFMRLYYYVCRGKRAAQFAKAFELSLPAIAAFTVNFFVAFSAFCLAFTVLNGSQSSSFSTVAMSYLTSFRFLLGMVDWQRDLGDYSSGFFVMLICFTLACFFLMFNTFPSVLTQSYKRATRMPHFDVEVLSLWLLLKPILRTVGLMRPEGTEKRLAAAAARRRSVRTASMASSADLAQQEYRELTAKRAEALDALRRGITLEELERNHTLARVRTLALGVQDTVDTLFHTSDASLSTIALLVERDLMGAIPALVDRSLSGTTTTTRQHLRGEEKAAATHTQPAPRKKSHALREAELRTRVFLQMLHAEQRAAAQGPAGWLTVQGADPDTEEEEEEAAVALGGTDRRLEDPLLIHKAHGGTASDTSSDGGGTHVRHWRKHPRGRFSANAKPTFADPPVGFQEEEADALDAPAAMAEWHYETSSHGDEDPSLDGASEMQTIDASEMQTIDPASVALRAQDTVTMSSSGDGVPPAASDPLPVPCAVGDKGSNGIGGMELPSRPSQHPAVPAMDDAAAVACPSTQEGFHNPSSLL